MNIQISNANSDSLRFNTGYTMLPNAEVRYKYDQQNILIEENLLLSSDQPFPIGYTTIAPNDSYKFYISFVPQPANMFTKENYYLNIWKILPTLQFILKQDDPENLHLISEPFAWQGVTISSRAISD